MFRSLSPVLLLWLAGCGGVQSEGQPGPHDAPAYRSDRVGHYAVGSAATPEQIAAWDIDIRPDGVGLPVGSGSVEDGEFLYEEQCAECHGSFGEGVGRYPELAGGEGTLTEDRPERTVGSYWPYTSTLFDYIYRAMPFTQPESLTVDETYAITAYVLYLNDLIDDDAVLDQTNTATIRLPNEGNFVPDPRPDVANERCMQNCRGGAAIEFHSEVAPLIPAVAVAAEAAAAAVHPGEETYEQYCSICHKVGVGGAPIVGESATWTSRLQHGVDSLVTNALNGMSSGEGVMPPKGGFTHLSDEDVEQAVLFMLEESS